MLGSSQVFQICVYVKIGSAAPSKRYLYSSRDCQEFTISNISYFLHEKACVRRMKQGVARPWPLKIDKVLPSDASTSRRYGRAGSGSWSRGVQVKSPFRVSNVDCASEVQKNWLHCLVSWVMEKLISENPFYELFLSVWAGQSKMAESGKG